MKLPESLQEKVNDLKKLIEEETNSSVIVTVFELNNSSKSIINEDNVKDFIKVLAQACGYTYLFLQTKNREHKAVAVRRTIQHIIKEHSNLSLSTIGELFRQDHSTVITSLKEVSDKISIKDPFYTAALARCSEAFNEFLKPKEE